MNAILANDATIVFLSRSNLETLLGTLDDPLSVPFLVRNTDMGRIIVLAHEEGVNVVRENPTKVGG